MNRTIKPWWRLLALTVMIPSGSLLAQSANTASAQDAIDDEEVIVLSPFEVAASEEGDGYVADSTLGGTRIRTELRDLATPLSVITSQFLKDTNATSNESLLQYTTNTEVGGLVGNYGGFGNSQGINESSALLQPNNNTRVRGLEQADGTRNFFISDIPWDSYNTERVEIQRGPNSILFGVGSPAGIINSTTKVAQMKDSGEVSVQVAQFASLRGTFDYNKVIIKDTLAIRVNALESNQQFRQDPAFRDDERVYGTVTFQPQLLPSSWAGRTVIRGSLETGTVKSNNPRILPPVDAITLFFDDRAGDGVNNPIGLGGRIDDMYLFGSGHAAANYAPLTGEYVGGFIMPAFEAIDGGPLNNGGVGLFYNNGATDPFYAAREAPRVYPGALSPTGSVDNTIGGMRFGSLARSASWNTYTKNVDLWDTREGRASRFPLAARGYYKDRTLSDSSIFNFYENLIDGDNKREINDWDAQNISIAQTFFDAKLGFEFVYDKQSYFSARTGLAMSSPYIGVDINKNLQSQLSEYTRVPDPSGTFPQGLLDMNTWRVPGFTPSASQPYANPGAGRVIVSSGGTDNFSRKNVRESKRFTAFGELDFSDFMNKDGFLTKLLGRHIFTGLVNQDAIDTESVDYKFISMDYGWAKNLSVAGELTNLNESTRNITPIFYISDFVGNKSSASGLNLDRITSSINPSGVHSINRFISNWLPPSNPADPKYVNPGAPYGGPTNYLVPDSTQSENPLNYYGYQFGDGHILNANVDYDQLVHAYQLDRRVIDSKGVTWQGYLADGLIVPTVGYREDELVTYTGKGAETLGVAEQSATLAQFGDVNKGETTSWGVVGHLPARWFRDSGLISGVSGYYNFGENQKVEIRYNYDGNPLDNPSAKSKDYGIVLRALNDKLSIKLGKYETKVKNGNLPGGGSLIGEQQYYLSMLEAWGSGAAFIGAFGNAGMDPNQAWFWNWANKDDPVNVPYGVDVNSALYKNHPSTIAQNAAIKDFIEGMDQTFFDNYQIPMNVAAVQAAYATGDMTKLAAAVKDFFPVGSYSTTMVSNSDNKINGITPNGSIDNTSEGYELEVNYRPTPNWDIQLNASKTTAYRESLGAPMTQFIEKQYERFKGPAGDLRIWWAGERSIKTFYEQNIISALRFQEESVGFNVPELRPWRFSTVTNYRFNEGRLNGFNIGGSFRWMDEQILGYGLKDDLSGLTVEKPFMSGTDAHFDLWMGYSKKLTDSINWRVQLNLRNVGESVGLVPISANPDGTIAASRIQEGMTWALTNTFSF